MAILRKNKTFIVITMVLLCYIIINIEYITCTMKIKRTKRFFKIYKNILKDLIFLINKAGRFGGGGGGKFPNCKLVSMKHIYS